MGLTLPKLNAVSYKDLLTDTFTGMDARPSRADGAMEHLDGLTTDGYPTLRTRKPRRLVRRFEKPHGITAAGRLVFVDGTTLYYGGQAVEGLVLTDTDKQFIWMGAQLIIWPDKVLYNTATGEVRHLEQVNTIAGGATAMLCTLTGENYDAVTVSAEAPAEVENGAVWLDTGSVPHTLRIYSAAYGAWQSVAAGYVRISAEGIGHGLKKLDAVTISGFADDALCGSFVLYGAEEDHIIISAVIDAAVTAAGPVTISRTVPDMDFICEHSNRLWGCSSTNHEIYASALGDPTNFNRFLGVSTDSYAATVGSAGDFTGCVSHGGYVLFLKEGCIHRMYGSQPSAYQLTTIACRGLSAKSPRGIAALDGTLYYRSPSGLDGFVSALPQDACPMAGETLGETLCLCAHGKCLYWAGAEPDGTVTLDCLDTERGTLTRETLPAAAELVSCGGVLYGLLADGRLYALKGELASADRAAYETEEAADEGRVSWLLETGRITLRTGARQRVRRLTLLLELERGTHAAVSLRLDGGAVRRSRIFGTGRMVVYELPVLPDGCLAASVAVEGSGQMTLYAIRRRVERMGEK